MQNKDYGKQMICPHVGIEDDPTTSLAYPSGLNLCHHARPVISPNLTHQNMYCLNPNFRQCPVFKGEAGKPLPASIGTGNGRRKFSLHNNNWKAIALVALALLLAFLVLDVAFAREGIISTLLSRKTEPVPLTSEAPLLPRPSTSDTTTPTSSGTPTWTTTRNSPAAFTPSQTRSVTFTPSPTPTATRRVIIPPGSTPSANSQVSTPSQTRTATPTPTFTETLTDPPTDEPTATATETATEVPTDPPTEEP